MKYRLTTTDRYAFVVQGDHIVINDAWIILYAHPPQGGPSREISRFNTSHIISVERL